MNKILLRLSQMKVQQSLILAAVISAVFYFSFFDSGEALDKSTAQLQVQIDEQQKKVKESDEALKKLEQIRASVASLNEQFKVASTQLPADIKGSEILKTVDNLARSAGVTVKSAEPRPTTKDEIVERIPLHVQLQGTYSELTMFLYYISIMERITRVSGFTMEQVPEADDQALKGGTLKFDGEIMSYRYIEDPNKKPDAAGVIK